MRLTGSDNGTGETVTSVETDSISSCRSVDLNLAGVRGEAVCRIFRGDTALEGKTTGGDVVLGQAKLLERGTRRNLDLRSDDVDAGDFLCDGVLDLTVPEGQLCIWPAWPKRLTFEG